MTEQLYTLEESSTEGYQRLQEKRNASVASAVVLWSDLLTGRAPSYFLQEALVPRTPAVLRAIESSYPGLIRFTEAQTISDFPLLTGDVLDRMMLARYREWPQTWRSYVKTATLRDFRLVRRIAADGLEGQYDSVPEQTEIEFEAMSETGYSYTPKKYAKGTHISFETLMNDDLSAFETIPDRLGRGGARTINKFVTQLYVDANGPHASLYTVGNANIVTGSPALSVASLGTAMQQLLSQTDANGEPIYIEEMVLVTGPGLKVTAQNIINQIIVDVTERGGTSNQTVRVNNWIASGLTHVVDPYIPIVASNANGATSWFLFASQNVGRPSLEVGFLTGFEEPQLYQRLANTARVGGGVDQMAGDFLTMSQQYKGVVAFGGTRLDPRGTIASDGSG